MDIPIVVASAFPPSPTLLLDRVRRNVDEAMLLEVASADYGCQAEEMVELLRPIRDTGRIPTPMPGQLEEVLELTRFCDPDRPNLPPFAAGPSGRKGHYTRLFACAILLRTTFDLSFDSTLANCLASAKVLGMEINDALGCFLSWTFPQTKREDDRMFIALALLIVSVRLHNTGKMGISLGEIADWVIALDWRRTDRNYQRGAPAAFSVQQGFWWPLALEFENEVAKVRDANAREKLELCGLLLNGE